MTHVCSDECLIVNRDHTTICRVTGKCYSQYINANPFYNDQTPHLLPHDDARTLKRQHVRRHRTAIGSRSPSSDKPGPRPKPHFNEDEVIRQIEALIELLLYSSKRTTGRTKPHASKHHYKKRRLVLSIPRDPEEVRKAVDAVFTVVLMVYKQRPFLKIKPIIVGSLYLMQHGKQFKQFSIERNQYLHSNLPSVSDLPRFDVAKNLVRIGSNVIIRCARGL